MSTRTRAFRRHHRQRVIKVEFRKRWVTGWTFNNSRSDEDRAEALAQATRAQRTARACSCYLCSNGRRKYGNGKAARTHQELHAIADLKQYHD